MLVVDAGPGTGKTHTIVRRYANLVSRPDVGIDEVLLLTFTNNAAEEMEMRAKAEISSRGGRSINDVRAKTFDAFCLSIVLEFAEDVSEFFGIRESLSRSARLQTIDTLNAEYFSRFFDAFNHDRGDDYGDFAVTICQYPEDVRDILSRLMSKGVMPLKDGWFGLDWEDALYGDEDALFERLKELSSAKRKKRTEFFSKDDLERRNDYGPDLPDLEGACLSDEVLESAARDDRKDMMRYIHDVYFAYIRKSISDNVLTFGLTALFAFALLYSNEEARMRNRYRYVMIDEFQDTNANQLMTALLILSEPNLCVVGDWKQGIYMFRYVSIDNITDFEGRATRYRKFLNRGEARVPFRIPEVEHVSLDVNYRSSQLVIDRSFDSLWLPGSNDDESLDLEFLEKNVVRLTQGRTDLDGSQTSVRFVKVGRSEEAAEVVRCVRDYMWSGRYSISQRDGGARKVRLGDIAVICRTRAGCRMVLEAAEDEGIPAYMQGELELMSTREGKLALAWIRYVNNERDPRGFPVVMADLGYPLVDITAAKRDYSKVPPEIDGQRQALYRKRRRVTDLLTCLYGFYGLDNDLTHAVITILSDAHRGSLMTLSDLSSMIENDILEGTQYPVEASIDHDAITIMTMHKSKGLEFPIVIIPFVDKRMMPIAPRESGRLIYDGLYGIRCTEFVGRFGDYSKICKSWRTQIVRKAPLTDYSEERRMMFVAMSRAEQHLTLICGDPSKFMSALSDERYEDVMDVQADVGVLTSPKTGRPDVSGYKRRRRKLGVHDIMRLNTGDGQEAGEGCDEFSSKGIQYGKDVHDDAESMFRGIPLTRSLPEHAEIRKVLESTEDADLRYAEMDCGLPLNDLGVTLRGVMDLIAVYPDRIEVYDYKTDETDRFEQEYMIQLSVYAHAASGYYGGRPAKCHIAYVSMARTVDFDPLPMEAIEDRTKEVLSSGLEESLRGPAVDSYRFLSIDMHGRPHAGRGGAEETGGAGQPFRKKEHQDVWPDFRQERLHASELHPAAARRAASALRQPCERIVRHADHNSEHYRLHFPGDARQAPPRQDCASHQPQGHGHTGWGRGCRRRGGARQGRRRGPPLGGPGAGRRHRIGMQVAGGRRVPPDWRVEQRRQGGRGQGLFRVILRGRRGLLQGHRPRGRFLRVRPGEERQEHDLEEDPVADGDRFHYQHPHGHRRDPDGDIPCIGDICQEQHVGAYPGGVRSLPRHRPGGAVPAHNSHLHDSGGQDGGFRGPAAELELRGVHQPH